MGVQQTDPLSQLSLPPGFRFYPTDEELMVQYLCRKVAGQEFSLRIIGDIDLYKYDPWVLPEKAIFGEKEWYFFSPRDRKYPNGSRPNRVAGSGYWKATGTDKVITTEGRKVGIKKALVFYIGKAPKGTKTNWIMHEYRLFDPPQRNGSSRLDDWVLCRIYKKSSSAERGSEICSGQSKEHSHGSSSSVSSHYDDVLETLPEFGEDQKRLGSDNFDWADLASIAYLPELGQGQAGMGFNVEAQNPSSMFVPSFQFQQHGGVYATASATDEEVQSGVQGNPTRIISAERGRPVPVQFGGFWV